MQLKDCRRGLSLYAICILLAFATIFVADVSCATYKKPPFNGSIFGKRSNAVSEYESTGRSLSTLCEIASEACTTWFSQIEAKK